MATVTVIGAGAVGSAVAGLARRAGADVQVLARNKANAEAVAGSLGAQAGVVGDPVTGEIVVLAVPFDAFTDVLTHYPDGFESRIVVDVSNPVDLATFDDLGVPADSSATRVLAEAVPGARVVKAFNTNFASTLQSGRIGDAATTVLVAGDDADAKTTLIDLVQAAGLRGVDAGGVKRARELEALAFLQITLAAGENISWAGGFALAD